MYGICHVMEMDIVFPIPFHRSLISASTQRLEMTTIEKICTALVQLDMVDGIVCRPYVRHHYGPCISRSVAPADSELVP